jgi:hypothetical protein
MGAMITFGNREAVSEMLETSVFEAKWITAIEHQNLKGYGRFK